MTTTTTDDPSRPNPRVWVLNVNAGQVGTEFADALSDMRHYDLASGLGMWGGKITARSGANISKSRNELVSAFLAQGGDWALLLDSDMVPPPDTMARLVAVALRTGSGIVGGLCVMATPDGPIPTLYQHDTTTPDGVTRVQLDYPDDAILQVAATGTACLLVHRRVFEKMAAADPGNPFPWFIESVLRGRWVSEDLTFCLRAGDLGESIYVDCTLDVGHAKYGRVWHARDIRDGVGFRPRPAVAVIPTKSRLDLLAPLVRQLLDEGRCADVVVVDNGSNKATRNWLESMAAEGVTTLDGDGMGIHDMWNLAAEYAVGRFGHRVAVAFLNNDLRLGPAFMARMLEALDTPEVVAVSANYDRRGLPDGPAVRGALLAPDVVEVLDIAAGRDDGTGGLAGFAFMVRGDFFTSGYRFPTECRWWYGDNDLVLAARNSGHRLGLALRAEVEHLDGGSQTGDWTSPEMAEQLAADRLMFEDRWRRFKAEAEASAGFDRPWLRLPTQTAGLDLDASYRRACETPSDISEHLPTLRALAVDLDARKVIELGTRGGASTVAWLSALEATDGQLWTVDLDPAPFEHPRMVHTIGDDLDPFVIAQLPDEVDVVFVDSSHEYEHTKAEIAAYRPKLRPGGCFVFHDTAVEAFDHHEAGSQPPFPVRKAVDELVQGLADHPYSVQQYENNHGLTVVRVGVAA